MDRSMGGSHLIAFVSVIFSNTGGSLTVEGGNCQSPKSIIVIYRVIVINSKFQVVHRSELVTS
jgi:hypothetical protein